MSDRYTRRTSDGEQVCTTCGSLVSNHLAHDLFHNRINLMYDAIPVSMIETSGHPITATDWQAAHDAGEDEELWVTDLPNRFEDGVQAARDAVAATFGDHPCTRLSCTDDRCIGARKALDAIDALRGES